MLSDGTLEAMRIRLQNLLLGINLLLGGWAGGTGKPLRSDDFESIQAALDSLPHSGGTAVVPPGNPTPTHSHHRALQRQGAEASCRP